MNQAVRKIGFLCLPDDMLEIFSAMTRRPGYRPEVVIDFNQNAYSYRMAEILQIPTAADIGILKRFPCQVLVIPDGRPDLRESATRYMSTDPEAIRTVSEMARELGLTLTTEPHDYQPADFKVPVEVPKPELRGASRLTPDSEIRKNPLMDRLVIDRMEKWNAERLEAGEAGEEPMETEAAAAGSAETAESKPSMPPNGSAPFVTEKPPVPETDPTPEAEEPESETASDDPPVPEAVEPEAVEPEAAEPEAVEPEAVESAPEFAEAEPTPEVVADAVAEPVPAVDAVAEPVPAVDAVAEAVPAPDAAASVTEDITAVAETLSLAFDKHLLLKRILDIAVTSVGGDAGSIMLLDETGDYLKIAVATGLGEDILRATRQKVGEGVAGNVLMEGRGRVVTEKLNDPRYRAGRTRNVIAAAVSCPIRVGNRSIGVLNVSSNRVDAFNGETLTMLDKFGVQVAGVILKALELPSENGASLEATLKGHIDAIMSLSESLPRRLEAVADRLAVTTGASAARIYIFDATGKRLEVLGGNTPAGQPRFVIADQGVRGWVLQNGEPEALMSTGSETDRRAIFYIPIETSERIGLIELESVPVDDARRVEILGAMTRNAAHLSGLIERDRATRAESRRNEQMLRLSDLAAEMMCCASVGDVLDMALKATEELFGADLVAFSGAVNAETTLSRPRFAERGDLASMAVLDFNGEMCAEVQSTGRLVSPATMSDGLMERLTMLGQVRWAAAIPLAGREKSAGVLSLFGMDAESQLPAKGEWAILEKLGRYLARAIEKAAAQTADATEGFLRWTLFQDRIGEEYKRANRYGRTFALTTIEIEEFTPEGRKRGQRWSDAARTALADFIRREIREVDIVSWVQEGRIAVLSPEVGPDESALSRRIEERWSDLLPALKLDGLDRLPMRLREMHFPRDLRTWDDCVAWIQDPFAETVGEARAAG